MGASLGGLLREYLALHDTVQAMIYSQYDMPDAAFERLDYARRTLDPNLLSLQYWPSFKSLHGDLRWNALITDIRNR